MGINRFIRPIMLLGIGIFVSVLTIIPTQAAQPISDRILSKVNVRDTQNCTVVTIEFNYPIQLVSVFPENKGDSVEIGLRPVNTGGVTSEAFFSREELRAPANKKAAIQEIQYEGDDPTGPKLVINFEQLRYYTISIGQNLSSIEMLVADHPLDKGCAAGAAADSMAVSTGNSTLLTIPSSLDANAVYAINLLSQQTEFTSGALPQSLKNLPNVVYTTRFEQDGLIWNRLRVGFFKTRTEAQKALSNLTGDFPDGWIVRTTQTERDSIYNAWLKQRKAGATTNNGVAPTPVTDLPDNEEAAALLAEAKDLMTKGEYARAIQLLTKVTQLPDNSSSPEAREMLGLARQKNDQLAHAKAEYEEYLRRFPDAEGAARVRQRLSSLLTQGKEAPTELSKGKGGRSQYVRRLNASLSQYYQRDESTIKFDLPEINPDPDKQVNQNALVSGADINASISNDRVDATFRLSGSYTNDFVEGGRGDFGTLSALYLDVMDSKTRLSARIGRQTRSTGGVLGRFDGALVSYEVNDNIKLNAVGGAPVIRSRDLFIEKSRQFLGASVDLDGFWKGVNTTFYIIQQNIDDLTDRQAIGSELRYVDKSRSAYMLIDYDTFYKQVNLALFNGSWRLKDNTSFNLSLDYRNAPSLATLNAIQGEGVETIDELRDKYLNLVGGGVVLSDDDIYYLAKARTAKATSGTLSVSKPLTKKLQFNGSVTLTNIGDTQSAGLLEGLPSTGTDGFYSAQLLGTSLFKDGDLASFGVRYDDMATAERYIFDVNTRYPVSRKLRVNPRLRLAQRNSRTVDQTQFTVKPSLRVTYIPIKLFQLELDAGAEWTQTDTVNLSNMKETENLNGYFVNAGYRMDF
ncbi:MAG: SPOR domain-containing protein [bacterium]